VGYVLTLEALLLLLPCIVALYYNEQEGYAYLASSAICLVLGGAMSLKKPKSNVFYLKEGCVATALSWIVLSVFGAIPFVLTGEIPHFVFLKPFRALQQRVQAFSAMLKRLQTVRCFGEALRTG